MKGLPRRRQGATQALSSDLRGLLVYTKPAQSETGIGFRSSATSRRMTLSQVALAQGSLTKHLLQTFGHTIPGCNHPIGYRLPEPGDRELPRLQRTRLC